MAKINQHISNIRALIKQYGRNPDVYTDGFLYSLLNGARNILLEQNVNKKNFISEWDNRQYPIRLVKDKSHLVKCVTVGCDILRSEYELPRALLTNNKSLFKVTDFSYKPITLVTEREFEFNKYDDIKKNTTQASIVNDYLIIWNNLKLKSVLIKGIWEDVLDWSKLPQCDSLGNYSVNHCFNALTEDFPLSETLKDAAYSIVLKKLDIPLSLIGDKINDSTNEIR